MSLEQEFIKSYSHQSFPHAERLFTALRDLECEVRVTPPKHFPCRHYEEIYRFRAHRPRMPEQKLPTLYNEMVYLYETLARTPDESCRIWVFDFPNGQSFACFEVVESNSIAGCFPLDKSKTQVNNDLY